MSDERTDGEVTWRLITDDVAVMSFPWHAGGVDFKRNVTLLRLSDGRVVIHSTASFAAEDIAAIRRFGEPAWLVDATLMHETFAKQGRAAFPDLPYLAPDGFTKASGITTEPLDPPPSDWQGEIDVLKLDGNRMNEHVFFHRRSATLGRGRPLFFLSERNARLGALFCPAYHAVAALVRRQCFLSFDDQGSAGLCEFDEDTVAMELRARRRGPPRAD